MAEREMEKKRFFKGRRKKFRLKKEDITVVDMDSARRAVLATSVGNAMEWFDFGIYSYLAVTIGKVFFPEMKEGVQLIYAFATFAVAFLARPLGGFVFGMLGDRWGRKRVLATTLILMAVSTLSIGLIPGYESIGSTATVLLLLARLVQGFSTGGEYAGAMTFIAESTPDKKRGVMSSGLEVGTLIGYIAGAGFVTLLTLALGSDTMVRWGWRIPFLVAGPMGLIGYYLRERLEETPAFEAMEEARDRESYLSVRDILASYWRTLLIGMVMVFFYNVVNYTVLSYMPSHLSAVLGYGETRGLLLIVVVMAIMIPIVLLMGYFSDRVGSKRVVQGGLAGLVLLSIPSFLLIGSGKAWWVLLGLVLLGVFSASFQGTMPSLLPSLFYTEVRYGALAITYNISASVFGGTTPLVVSWLINWTGDRLIPAYYLVAVSVIGLMVVTKFVKDPSGKSLRGSPPAVEKKREIKEVLQNPEEALWWQEEKEQRERERE
ncbi:MFS transporter, MHS family, proline/betaine transporter [Planifilum fulgidum]|uniref:Putative proline/betaine transporter n=2 Tax=Planifilum fulgidum TaxID=201973 RepID=A0A1I2MV16_9BACL|nr:MFS transporter, MHS family, proline/betaine transporter [Planifilum fulgidum]